MLNLNDVYLFVQAVQHGGFAPAARALQMSKSSLSSRIASLEQQLGVRLVQRTSRQFAVTDVGWEFHKHARAMLEEARSAEEAVQRRLAEPAGPVRIASSSGTLLAGLALALSGLVQRYPKLEVVQHASNEAVDLVSGGYDLAVRSHQNPLADSSLIQRRLGFCARWLVAAPSYLRRRGAPERPEDLEGHDGVCMPHLASVDGWLLHGETSEVRGPIKSRFQSDDLSSLATATLEGIGIGMLPAGACRAALAEGRLVRVLPRWIAGGAQITLLAPHRRGRLPAVRAAADYIASELPHAMMLDA